MVGKVSDYLSVGEAAKYVGVSRDTMRRWDRSGKLAARRHPANGFRLYLRTDLDSSLWRIAARTGGDRSARREAKKTKRKR